MRAGAVREVGTMDIGVRYLIPDVEGLFLALRSRSVQLSTPTHHDDQLYCPTSWPRTPNGRDDMPVARLYTVDGRHFFSSEHPRPDPALSRATCATTEVTDRDAMHEALLTMGFSPTTRMTGTHRDGVVDDVALCIDEIERQGLFLEAKRDAVDQLPREVVQAQLADVVASLGVGAVRVNGTHRRFPHPCPTR